MDTNRALRLVATVPLLLACLAWPLSSGADPWKDESGKGRKHFEWKDRDDDRGKGRSKSRDKHFEKARERAEKRWEKHMERAEKRRERTEREREEARYVARRTPVPASRVVVTRPAASSSLTRAVSRPAPTTATTVRRAPAPAYPGRSSSTDARRRAAVSSYINRHPGG